MRAGKREQNEVLGNRCKGAGVHLAGRGRVCDPDGRNWRLDEGRLFRGSGTLEPIQRD